MSLKEKVSGWFIKFIFKFLSTWVYLRSKYGQVSIIKDKILTYAHFLKKGGPPVFPELTGNVGNEVLDRLKQILDKHGDFDCLVNGYFSLSGSTSSCGEKSKSLSKVIRDSKLYAAAFWNAGLRKGTVTIFF